MNSTMFMHTEVNKVNDNIQIVLSSDNIRRVIILPMSNIIYVYVEGPFGSYDIDENPIEIWNLCIEVDRPTRIRNIIRLEYRTYISAEEVLIKINNCLY